MYQLWTVWDWIGCVLKVLQWQNPFLLMLTWWQVSLARCPGHHVRRDANGRQLSDGNTVMVSKKVWASTVIIGLTIKGYGWCRRSPWWRATRHRVCGYVVAYWVGFLAWFCRAINVWLLFGVSWWILVGWLNFNWLIFVNWYYTLMSVMCNGEYMWWECKYNVVWIVACTCWWVIEMCSSKWGILEMQWIHKFLQSEWGYIHHFIVVWLFFTNNL